MATDDDRYTKRELLQRLKGIAAEPSDPTDELQRFIFKGRVVGSDSLLRVALEPGQGQPPAGTRVMVLVLAEEM